MKTSTKIIISILFLQVIGITSFSKTALQDTVVVRMNPEEAIGGSSDEIFKEVTYIPLENSNQSIVGEISKLEVVNDYLIILDRSMDQILIFNADGTFHAKCEKIGGLHKNANMTNNFNFNIFGDFAIHREKKQIVVRTNLDRSQLFIYNLNGTLTNKIPLSAKENGNRFWGFAFLDHNTSAYTVSHSLFQADSINTSAYELFLANNFSSIVKKEIPYDQNNIAKATDVLVNLSGPFYYSGGKKYTFFTRPYDYNIYKIDSNGISRTYKIILPLAYSIPDDFLVNEKKYKTKRFEYLDANPNLVYAISNVYYQDDHLIFTINNNRYDQHKIFSYDLASGLTLSLLNISPDISSYFLPLVSQRNSIQACDGNNLYTSFSSLELFKAREATKDKHPQYPSELNKFFTTENLKSNPIIVRLTPKTKI